MSKMPLRFYLPRFEKLWNNQIWQFTILRDYGIELDFRKGSIIDWLLTPREKQTFLEHWFMKRN
jgi:hypothetical protein